MLELTGVASVLRGISILYWLVAAAALTAVLWRIKSWRGKTVGAIVVVAVFGFMPIKGYVDAKKRQDYAREAWAYFKKLCDEKSGQKIYKTFTGVKSVLVIKPLPPATEKDLYDQYWYGDPYSDATPSGNRRNEYKASILIGSVETRGYKPTTAADRIGFAFVESYSPSGGNDVKGVLRYFYPKGASHVEVEQVTGPVSRFGVSWEDISTPEDRKYWVAGSRLRIIDLTDTSVVAERIGYFIEAGFGSQGGARRPWLASRGANTTCPKLEKLDVEDRLFIQRALNPSEGN
jgi:hypothetical protein